MNDDIPALPPRVFNHGIAHYHGDTIRALFVASVVISLIIMPLWGNLLPISTFFQILGSLGFIVLAGLTSPHNRVVMLINVIASIAAVLLLEVTAINFYPIQPAYLFWGREIEAILLMFALYLSIRTLRSMMAGQIGKVQEPWEFEDVVD